MTPDFLHIMKERGFFHQCTDESGLGAKLKSGQVTAYTGYDATASSLHVGSLMSIMMMRWFQKCGHKPVVLMGGGTTKVGDPSGRDETRKLLTDADINANIAGIKSVFAKFIDFKNAAMVNNNDWLSGLNYIEFLRDYGRHFTINRMLTFDSVKTRLEREQPLTFLEFNYMILQAYDFLELARQHNCTLQFGGSDQWGNIVNGIELGRRVDNRELYGLTCPLLTTSSGAKMGKSASGAVWLNADMLSPYDYYQFWRNAEDADAIRFLKIYTELPMDEIGRLEKLKGAEINEAKKVLAFEATRMCHGDAAANEAAESTRKTFENKDLGAAPKVTLPRAGIGAGVSLVHVITSIGMAKSNREARQKVQEGAVRVNGDKISDPQHLITPDYIANHDNQVTVSVGKTNHKVVVWEAG